MRRAAVVLAVVVCVAVAAPAAVAQPDDVPAAPGIATVALESFTGVLGPDDDVRVRVRVTNRGTRPLSDLRVVGTLHRRTFSRFDYQQAVDQGDVGAVWSSFGGDLDVLQPDGSVVLEIVRSAAELGFASPGDSYGVYPMRVQLLLDGTSVDEVMTSVVVAPDTVEDPVRLATLWPFDVTPARLADGSFVVERLLDDITAEGRLRERLDALDGNPVLPVTLAPTGLFLHQVADLADGFSAADGRSYDDDSRAAQAAAAFLDDYARVAARPGVEQVAQPYAPADLVALVRGGLHSEAVRDVVEGRATIAERTGSAPAPSVLWPPDGLNPETLRMAVGAGVDTVVLSEPYLAVSDDRELQWTPSPVRRLRWSGGPALTAVVPDPWLADTLAEPAAAQGAAVAAQRVLAETAAVYFERPYASETRGLALALPQGWDPVSGVPAALVAGMRRAPWLEPVDLSDLVDAVPPAPHPVGLAYPEGSRGAELPERYVGAIRDARVRLGSLASALPADDAAVRRFDTQLRAAASVHYRDRELRAEGRAKIAAVSDTVERLYEAVDVVDSPAVVLTSLEGQIPVTLVNDAPVPLRVQVRLQTNRYTFEGGGTQEVVLEPDQPHTLTFAARALTAGGTQPIRVVVEDPEGSLVLATGGVVVRSTAYSRIALIVTGTAALFLLLWWLRDVTRRRTRGGRALRREPTRTTVSSGGPGG